MEATLKPCPFCNGACRDQKNGPKLNRWWEVVCDECDFCGPAFDTEQEAVDHWNIRAPAWQPIETAADRIAELEAENARLRDALERIDDASNHYAMTPTYSEGTLRYAHKSTRNLARAALNGKKYNGD